MERPSHSPCRNGIPGGENIDIVNVATNATQERNVFFTKLKSRIKSGCFMQFAPNNNRDTIEFPNGLRLHSLHAQNEGWEGLNILAWVMDEASGFRTAGGADNSDAAYTTLRTSANSRFPSQWADDIEDDGYTMPSAKTTIDKRWIGVIISFARRQEGDFTLKKYEEAVDNPRIFADKATTFEVNPQFDPDHPFYRHFRWEVIDELNIRVPSPYADEFRTDPTESATKYLCQPPPQEHGFFELPKKIDACVDKARPLPVVTPDIITRYIDQGGDQSVSQRYLKVHLDGLPEREKDCEYYIHGDPALYTDDFVVSLAHKTPETMTLVDSEGESRTVNRVVVDFIIVWKPKPGIPVDLLDVEEKILMLAKLYDVETVTFGRWNSANSIQRLFSVGIFSHDYSFSQPQQLAIYRNLKALIHNDMVSLPDEPDELKLLKLENGTTTSPARTGPTR